MVTPADIVAKAMGGEHGDLLRDAVSMVVRELMEAEVAQLLDQPARARQPRDRSPRRCRQHLPNDASALRLTGALLIEQNDEWLVCRRYLSDESMRLILDAVTELDVSPPNDDEQEDHAALAA